jgi:hypothetical protein
MRLREKQKTSEAVWAKLVKALIHNRQAALFHGPGKQGISMFRVEQYFTVAVGEITNVMLSKFQSRVHSHLRK